LLPLRKFFYKLSAFSQVINRFIESVPQTTFNEYGLCYTFNNVDQGIEDRFKKAEEEDQKNGKIKTKDQIKKDHQIEKEDIESTVKQRSPMTIRKVTGCGRNHGFQLVVDSQQVSFPLSSFVH
jgi:hypothetical protein